MRGSVKNLLGVVLAALMAASGCASAHEATYRNDARLFVSEGPLEVPHFALALVQVNASGFGAPIGPVYYGFGPDLERAKRQLVAQAEQAGADGIIDVTYRAEGVKGFRNILLGLLHGPPRVRIHGIAVKLGERRVESEGGGS